ncbi:MAG: XRE family transcriptional regulator [Janthinobacterium lividum]
MNILGRNIRKLRESLNESQTVFAARLDLNRGQIASYEAEEKASEPSMATVLKMVDAFNIDLRAFVSDPAFAGVGKSLPPSNVNHIDKAAAPVKAASPGERLPPFHPVASPRILVVTTDSDEADNISLVNTRVAAGYAGGGFVEPEFVRRLPSFRLPDPAYRNGTFRAFQVSGESMQPTLYEGDWVICRFLDSWDREIQDTFVHVVVTDEVPVVKRVLNRLGERGQLTLQSDNPAFAAQFLDAERVREVWRAVGRLSRQFANPRYDLVKEVSRTRADVDELFARLTNLESPDVLKQEVIASRRDHPVPAARTKRG